MRNQKNNRKAKSEGSWYTSSPGGLETYQEKKMGVVMCPSRVLKACLRLQGPAKLERKKIAVGRLVRYHLSPGL